MECYATNECHSLCVLLIWKIFKISHENKLENNVTVISVYVLFKDICMHKMLVDTSRSIIWKNF